MLIGGVGELLSQNACAIARKQRRYRRLRLCVRALDVLQVVVAIAVGTVVGKRRVRAEAVLVDVKVGTLCQLAITTDTRRVGDANRKTV